MGKTPERRVFASAPLRYRRKVPVPEDNQQAEEPKPKPKQQQQQTQKLRSSDRSSRSPPGRRFRPKAARQPKHQQQQPPLLKQLLWKAKAVQPTPASLSLPLQSGGNNAEQQQQQEEEEEDEEAAFAQQQRQARKLLASEAEALAASKQKAAAVVSPADAFVAESSSQETQSGSEDETVFLPYNGLPTTKWQLYAKQQQQEEAVRPVMPSQAAEEEEAARAKEQDELEKAAATRRKLRQKYKLKQKQKRKEQKRLQHQQRQEEENERPRSTDGDEDEHTAVDIFHPPTNLASDMDAGVCRAVLSQLKEVVPFIVIGDVACPVVVGSEEQPVASAASVKGGASAADSDAAVVDFREHVIAMLDRSKETQMQYRDSFVLESSGFDAASSYDFFKRRFCEIDPITARGVLEASYGAEGSDSSESSYGYAPVRSIGGGGPRGVSSSKGVPRAGRRTLLPPPSPPLAGERLPSSESALALLLLSSVMGVNFNTPFDDVVSVGAEEEDDEDDDGDFEEDESDDEELDPSEFDDTALASDPSRLESSLELLSASEPEALGPTDPELETRSAVSDDDEDGKLLATAVELELDSTFKLAELVSALADAASEDVDATTDPLASDGDPPADPLAPEANKDPVDGVELDVELTESSIKDPEPEELGDRSPDDESAPFPPDEDAASELDADGGIAVTGAGLVAVAVGVERTRPLTTPVPGSMLMEPLSSMLESR
ncbi:hypothetical protein PF007_g26580 [Phytophthora fragariae]|uniref:Uncharacterized protein n=1 Tax=Phytophthora fragariae TaxID=53985 RepID=A0A6A3QA41_9STRA|nr:hypothetical protein PF007_g26580 [Phytophthora fragariae]